MTDTLRYVPEEATDATLISSRQDNVPAPIVTRNDAQAVAAFARRSTVLPRIQWNGDRPDVVPFERERFEEVSQLGQGGMGEVVLLKDHDIERMVALKRLPEGADLDRVLRFVEEIRTVGQLDHPNIVPVHDVGIDQRGRYFFVMKHLQGETLESIIDKLRQGDAAMHARFTFPMRVQVFLGVLNAVAYAHRKGIIHRDLKPANIMVGPYGEVTVVDWGLARRVRQPDTVARTATPASTPANLREAISMQTQLGAVVGTPLYMSPEQARGQHDAVDVRSDTYSLTALFHEFLCLHHYLEGRETLAEVLDGVQNASPGMSMLEPHPLQPTLPAELGWFIMKGLAKNPAERYQSVDEMKDVLMRVMDGRIDVHCQRTLLKNGLHKALRLVDQRPNVFLLGLLAVSALMFTGLMDLMWKLLD
ncbi:serine/threonine-protein kinase [Archangium lipolyticum]|uniref:serine/threonine-protein kinase n=1 Tax=Archangium lipolyticum TaxID=2970465 RepID=UPI002149C516|nr:serine/threonine-protein kinase [Archangium lipolyticum]